MGKGLRSICMVIALIVAAGCSYLDQWTGVGPISQEQDAARDCQINLVKLEGATEQWAVEYDKADGTTLTMADLVGKTLYLKRTPRCPKGGNYPAVLTVGKIPTCSYEAPPWFDTQGDRYKHKNPDAPPSSVTRK